MLGGLRSLSAAAAAPVPSAMQRQASVGNLCGGAQDDDEEPTSSGKQPAPSTKQRSLKAARSKRCKSLLMLSSPFSSSTSSLVKSSLLSLLHPGGQQQQQQQQVWCEEETGAQHELARAAQAGGGARRKPAKCVKMKLFKQPLEKLLDQKAMKAVKQLAEPINEAPRAAPTGGGHTKRKRTASHHHHHYYNNTHANNSGATLCRFNSLSDTTTTTTANNNSSASGSRRRRHQLQLACLPEPIRNLLQELYLRAPSTPGIFRKSPSARHCKELRQRLEADSLAPVGHHQVSVIASVFKEWLRSLPDCLLTSRLYPQWMDVARLIEPLYEGRQQQQQQANKCPTTTDTTCDTPELRRLESGGGGGAAPLTDKELAAGAHRSISGPPEAAHLSERHFECLRILRQLLDALPPANQILLRAFLCVLWHIARNSAHNMMSASNLGVCVGQSLLHDDRKRHAPAPTPSSAASSTSSTSGGGGGGGFAGFTKRHRRSRSQCLLPGALQQHPAAGSILQPPGSHLKQLPQQHHLVQTQSRPTDDSSSAQESARYVPLLVAFLIENALALFGPDLGELFEDCAPSPRQISPQPCEEEQQHRVAASKEEEDEDEEGAHTSLQELTANCCSSSSRASSSTSGVHSASPVSSGSSSIHESATTTTTDAGGGRGTTSGGGGATLSVADSAGSPGRSPVSSPGSPALAANSLGRHDSPPPPPPSLPGAGNGRHCEPAAPLLEQAAECRQERQDGSVKELVKRPTASPTMVGQSESTAAAAISNISNSEMQPHQSAATAAAAAPINRNRNRNGQLLNWYGPYVSVITKVPKIPQRLSSSTYGDSVIYNPKPQTPATSMEPADRRLATPNFRVASERLRFASVGRAATLDGSRPAAASTCRRLEATGGHRGSLALEDTCSPYMSLPLTESLLRARPAAATGYRHLSVAGDLRSNRDLLACRQAALTCCPGPRGACPQRLSPVHHQEPLYHHHQQTSTTYYRRQATFASLQQQHHPAMMMMNGGPTHHHHHQQQQRPAPQFVMVGATAFPCPTRLSCPQPVVVGAGGQAAASNFRATCAEGPHLLAYRTASHPVSAGARPLRLLPES